MKWPIQTESTRWYEQFKKNAEANPDKVALGDDDEHLALSEIVKLPRSVLLRVRRIMNKHGAIATGRFPELFNLFLEKYRDKWLKEGA